jgi:hypothetical protein
MNTWPPFFSVVCIPLTLLGHLSIYLVTSLWVLLNFAVLLLLLDLLARILYGRPMTLRRSAPGRLSITSVELLVPLALTSTFLFSNFEMTQINIILLGLTLGGLYLLASGRTLGGALAIGFAIAIKVMPVVILPYLAYRRAWRAFLASSLAAAAFSLSPILVFGWSRFWQYVAIWRRVIGWGWGVGANNQSIFAMWDRFIGLHVYPYAPGENLYLVQSDAPGVRLAWWITMGVIGLLALRQFRIGTAASPWVAAAEWSAVLIVSALAGPVSWKHYMVVLLLPNALLFAVWRRPDIDGAARAAVGWVLCASVVLAVLTAHDLVGGELSTQLELGGVATLSGLVMLGGLFWLRGRRDLLIAPDAPPPFVTG